MNKMRSNQFQGAAEILAEFQDSDTDLARNLLNLCQEPSGVLQDRVRAIPGQAPYSPDRAPSLPASLRAWGVWRRGVRIATVWLGAVILVAATLLAFFPGLRTATAQAVETLGRILVGSSYTPGGFVRFTPAPPFVVKQPNYLPAGFDFVGERYNTGSPAQNDQPSSNLAQSSAVQSPGSVSAGGARQAIERDRGREAYIVLGYEAPHGPYLALFERAARPGETLPAGEPRMVTNQAAVLQRSGQILTLTWISAGTWLELEGRLPEAELLKVAEGLTVSQTSDATSADATPVGVQSTSFEIPRLSLDEAQKQVSFHIPVLTWMPPGFKLGGAHVMPPDWANTFYVPTDPKLAAAYAGIGVSIRPGKDTTSYSITGAQVQEEIMVNGHPAQYMAGPSVGMLMWEADGFSYNLTYSGFALSREDVKRLAESLR